MSKDKQPIEEIQEDYSESMQVDTFTPDEPVDGSKQVYFFPNVGEGEAFGGEFSSAEEAEAANTKHLEESKKVGK